MPITFFGQASVPADNGSNSTTATTITPVASMLAGDLTVVHVTQRGTGTWSVGVTGGQTWNEVGANNVTTNVSAQTYWARFDGTWTANPRFDCTSGTNTTVIMLVFRPNNSTSTWGFGYLDDNNFGGPSFETYSFTPDFAPSVTIGVGSSADDNTWGNLVGSGWTKSGLSNQWRNLAGQDSSTTAMYYIQDTIDIVPLSRQTQLTLGADSVLGRRLHFYEIPSINTKPNFFSFFN